MYFAALWDSCFLFALFATKTGPELTEKDTFQIIRGCQSIFVDMLECMF
jgi:hypothetical protein